jgi:hypothetical protein
VISRNFLITGVWATVEQVSRQEHIGVRVFESPDMTMGIDIRDFPTGLRIVVEDRCWKGQPSQESMPSGIGNRRIGDPERVSSTHSNSTNFETPTGESTWSRGLAGHMRTELAGGS